MHYYKKNLQDIANDTKARCRKVGVVWFHLWKNMCLRCRLIGHFWKEIRKTSNDFSQQSGNFIFIFTLLYFLNFYHGPALPLQQRSSLKIEAHLPLIIKEITSFTQQTYTEGRLFTRVWRYEVVYNASPGLQEWPYVLRCEESQVYK